MRPEVINVSYISVPNRLSVMKQSELITFKLPLSNGGSWTWEVAMVLQCVAHTIDEHRGGQVWTVLY